MRSPGALLVLALAACGQGGGPDVPGDRSDAQAFDGIGPGETIRFTGTEPFWGGEVSDGSLTYSTPEDLDGTKIAVTRFAGRGGLSLSGELAGRRFDMTITPGMCSDGMSVRTYPFVVTLRIGEETRNGCGWTEARPFSGPEAP
jgi:uncharacterized membrane protein